jgi:hypothetical protein
MSEDSPTMHTDHTAQPTVHETTGQDVHLRESRGDLVLFLGILSLFMCGPLGIIAWVVASSDLKGIRAGTVSPRRIRMLKTGRILGAIGALLFVIAITGVTFTMHRLDGLSELLGSRPLKPNEFHFVGEWYGNRGTYIKIHPSGKADYVTANSRIRGGTLTITEQTLSIGFFGFSKSWRIERLPEHADGYYAMQLDGEIFVRKSEDILVRFDRLRLTESVESV